MIASGLLSGPVGMRLRGDALAKVAMAGLGVLAVAALVGPVAVGHDPEATAIGSRLQMPGRDHLLGTDGLGRDVLARLVAGGRVSLLAAVEALVVAAVLGIVPGALAGYFRGLADAVLSRIFDALQTLPPLILALAILGFAGSGLLKAMVAIGVVLSPRFYRVARAVVLDVSTADYVEAARADGASELAIVGRDILPNALGPLAIQAANAVGFVVTSEAGLSFIGLGVEPPTSSWGAMLREAYDLINQRPYLVVPPAVMIVATVLLCSLLADALRDAQGRTGGPS